MCRTSRRVPSGMLDSSAPVAHTCAMGVAVFFLVLAVLVAAGLLLVVALPHLRRQREQVAPSRHTSRTARTES